MPSVCAAAGRLLAVFALGVCAGGCTTVKAVDMPAAELRSALRSGEVGRVGERIELVTADGVEHRLAFVGVDAAQDVVRGRAKDGDMVAVAVNDIVVLRSRQAASGKSALVAIAIAVAIALGVQAGNDFERLFEP